MSIIVNFLAAIMLTVLPFTAPCACDELTFFCKCDMRVSKGLEEVDSTQPARHCHSHCDGADIQEETSSSPQGGNGSQDPADDDNTPHCPEKKQGQSSTELSAAGTPVLAQVDSLSSIETGMIPAFLLLNDCLASDERLPDAGLSWPTSYPTPPPLSLLQLRTQRLLL